MSKIKLRDYQDIAKNKTIDWLENNQGNCLVAMPTATGKSLTIAGTVKDILYKRPRTKFLIVTSSKELVINDESAILALWSTAPVGVYCASLNRKEIAQVTVASVGSIARQAELLTTIDYVLIDEIQCVSHNENTQYRKMLNVLWENNPKMQVVGYSASPYRMSGGCLTDEHIFKEFAIDMTDFNSFNWFFSQSYLSQLTTKKTVTQLDVSRVKITAGEYNQKELQAAVDKDGITRAALLETISYGYDRKKWLIFGTGIDHVEHIASMLQDEFRVSTTFVHSKMSDEERDTRIKDFIDGKYQACVNNLILTVGVDIRECDMLVILQPTASAGRWVQVVGRGLRIAPKEGMPTDTREQRLAAIAAGNKPNGCLVLDFCGNTEKNGAINDIRKPTKKGKGGGVQPLKTCPTCATICHPTVRYCPDCGYEFVFEVKITHSASSSDIVAKVQRTEVMKPSKPPEPEPEWYDVNFISYTKHINRKTGIPMLKVSYNPSGLNATEWVSFEAPHGSWQRGAAYTWWSKRVIGVMPKTVDEALLYVAQLPTPKRIFVKSSKGYLNVSKVEFEEGLVINPLVLIEKEFDEGEVILSSDWGDVIPF